MKVLFILFFIPLSVLAQTSDFETRSQALEAAREKALMDWRLENDFELPNDNYVRTYQAEWEKFAEAQSKLHDEVCSAAGASCPEKNLLQSQARIAVGLVTVRNRWAREGKTAEAQEAGAAAFKSCAEEQKDCDKLSEADKVAAQQSRVPAAGSVEAVTEATTPAETPAVETPVVEDAPIERVETPPALEVEIADGASEPASTENEDEKNPKNYVPESCEWVTDLPRKIVNGPGCGPRSRGRICTGYVKCKQKDSDAFFVRMSTCAPEFCGNDDAVNCTKDMKYFSEKPQGEEKLFMTKKIKDAVTGSRQ